MRMPELSRSDDPPRGLRAQLALWTSARPHLWGGRELRLFRPHRLNPRHLENPRAEFAASLLDWRPAHHTTGRAGTFALSITLATAGCAPFGASANVSLGAPAIPLFDAFFPAWLLCAFVGVIGAVLVRVAFIRIGLDDILPLRLPVYVAVATIIGLLVSLFGFGR